MKDFCIIGSGISGATIANSLSKKYSLDVYDKARGVGGRSSNKKLNKNESFDHGVQYISPKSIQFKSFIKSLISKKILKKWTGNHIFLNDNKKEDKSHIKIIGRSGGTSNLYFERGSISYKDLLKLNQRTLYVTETIGHGSNLVTGDYSVGATGFMVENGVFKYPVSEITIAGNFKDIFKNITLADDLEVNDPLPATPIDPPTMSITISVNSSPLAGTEGKKLTSTQIRDRLVTEAQNNVGISFSQNANVDAFVISGRGELMLEILLTQMRREGFEMTVSPPKVLYQKDEGGNRMEPIEEITVDVDEEFSSKIIDSMNRRKGKLLDLKDTGKDKKRLIFHAPTRGLMGYTSRFLTLTKGTGVINRIFHGYGKFEGEMDGRKNGALISMANGKAVAFAIFNLQARGEMFVTHNDPVYEGMIVGLAPKAGDMIINVMKGKQLTNMRTQGTDENVVLTPVRQMSIAEQLSMLNTDEALEITPKSLRLRKAILNPNDRKKNEKSSTPL
ncbi:metallopeptidase TldD-related protein [Candidatus Pelagibacter sp.]|nr:metallopeptidase TldD-related protein [Candidatus Pelagibacter sp.]